MQRMRLFLATAAALSCVASLSAFAATLGESRLRCLSGDAAGNDAVSACTFAIKKKPKDANLFVQRGVAWSKMGDQDFAIGDFSKAIRLNPRIASAYFFRGLARETKGELQESLADFKRYAELNPSDAEAQKALDRVSSALSAKQSPKNEVSVAAAAAQTPDGGTSVTPERPAETAGSAAPTPSGPKDDFSLYLPVLFLIAGVAVVATAKSRSGTPSSREVDEPPAPIAAAEEPLATVEVSAKDASAVEAAQPPLAWVWSEYKAQSSSD
jgi:tetratricopeptide (TPR) repeat protein